MPPIATNDRFEPVQDPLAKAADGTRRLVSLDVLRGFDMFWIVGGASLVTALGSAEDGSVLARLRGQLHHVDWDGFRFYDMIFPLFVFIAGVSMVFSLSKAKENGGRAQALRRVVGRGLLLYLVGVFYSGGFKDGLENVRWLGVLNRIALAYTGAGVLFLLLPVRALVAAWAGLLLGYWAMMAWVPIRDIQLSTDVVEKLSSEQHGKSARELYFATTARVRGRYEPGYNVANHFDFEHLPGKKWDKYWDPEGILSTFPAIATCLLGSFAGLLLRRTDLPPTGKSVYLALAGVGLVLTGYAWGSEFPIIKKLWTSSFVFVAGGWSLLLLAAFHQVVDVW
jgi:predicted acyltransferase